MADSIEMGAHAGGADEMGRSADELRLKRSKGRRSRQWFLDRALCCLVVWMDVFSLTMLTKAFQVCFFFPLASLPF